MLGKTELRMRCKTAMLLAFALVSFVRVAMALNDPPYYLFTHTPDATDKPPLYYTKVCPVGKTEDSSGDRPQGKGDRPRENAGDRPQENGDRPR